MREEGDNVAVVFNSKGVGLRGKKSSPFIIEEPGFGPDYQGSRPSIKTLVETISPKQRFKSAGYNSKDENISARQSCHVSKGEV
jgi:hypothetical protein